MQVTILGDGGHSRVIQELLMYEGNREITAILDNKYKHKSERNGVIIASLTELPHLMNSNMMLFIGIGNNRTRKILNDRLVIEAYQYITIIHPSAFVSPTAIIGTGSVVMPHVIVNAGAKIGKHCIINTGAIVEHDCMIGDYVHLSPNATITGNVKIDEGVHIGASATVIPNTSIGEWSVIGAGSTVIKDIPPNRTAVGCPTRLVESKNTMTR